MTQRPTSDSQVVVVGGGPVGSVAAYLLASAGIDVTLIDENLQPALDYRASTFHPPTMDLLEPSGISAALTSMGLQCPVIQYRDRRFGPIGELDLSVLGGDTNYPYRLQCEQFKLTGWLHTQLADLPTAHLALGQSVTGLRQGDARATVATSGAGGDERHRGRYVLACDGARSSMRRALEIPFDGYTHPEQFLVAGARYDFKAAMHDIQSVNYTSDPDEWFLLLEIPDMWRIVVPVGETVATDDARADDYIQACLQNICPAPQPYDILVRSVYRVHQRVAAGYRAGVTFLAGDAAHVNNPLGGMGLNGGIHDVLLLTELLTQVLQGGDPDLLDSYEQRRRPIAINDINATTERNKRIMQERDPAIRAANNEHLREVCTTPDLAYRYALEVSMIRSLRDAGTLPLRVAD